MDPIIARHLHDKRMTRFTPTHKLILMSNSMPDAPMSDFAFWERILLIPFNFSFVDREPTAPNERRADKHLLDKLKMEAPGILAWIIRGCLKYQQMGLCPPEKVRAATEEYRRSEDLLATFWRNAVTRRMPLRRYKQATSTILSKNGGPLMYRKSH